MKFTMSIELRGVDGKPLTPTEARKAITRRLDLVGLDLSLGAVRGGDFMENGVSIGGWEITRP